MVKPRFTTVRKHPRSNLVNTKNVIKHDRKLQVRLKNHALDHLMLSKLKDKDGDHVPDILDCEPNNPNKQDKIVSAFHGSKNKFDKFEYGLGHSEETLGSGFYFTTSKDGARVYGDKIKKCTLTLKKGINFDDKNSLTKEQIKTLIVESPEFEESIMNFKNLNQAIDGYKQYDDMLNAIFALGNDFYRDKDKLFNENLFKLTGINHVRRDVSGGVTHYNMFFNEDIFCE